MNICVINPDVHIKMKMVGLKKYVQIMVNLRLTNVLKPI